MESASLGDIQNQGGRDPERPALADPALSSDIGPDDLQRCFSTSIFLWFCDSVISDSCVQFLQFCFLTICLSFFTSDKGRAGSARFTTYRRKSNLQKASSF